MTVKEKIEKLLEQTFIPSGFEILDEETGNVIDEFSVDESEVDPKGLILTIEGQRFLIQVSTL